MKILGPHDINGWPAGIAWARKANVLKSVGNTAAIGMAPAGAVTVYRWPFSEVDQSNILDQARTDPTGAAQRVVAMILGGLAGFRRPRLYVELLNEVGKGRRTEYVALSRAAVPLLHQAGVLVAGPSWATGDYEQEDWDAFAGVPFDATALHAYWSFEGFTHWNALRWKLFWKPGQRLVIVTECGRDRVRDGNPNINEGYIPLGDGPFGYSASSQSCSSEMFIAELEAYDALLVDDPAVIGATAFTTSPSDDWRDKGFGMDGIAPRLAALTVPWTPRTPITAPPAPQPTPAPTGGTLDTASAYTMPHRISTATDTNYGKNTRLKTLGVVLHSTAGGSSQLKAEWAATINYFQLASAEVSAHVVVGPDEVAVCVPEDLTAWHCRELNATHLGIELAWPDSAQWNAAGVKYPPAYYDYAGEIIARWALKYKFPIVWSADGSTPGLVCHKDTIPGKRDGRRDPTGGFDRDALLTAAKAWNVKLGGKVDNPKPIPVPTSDTAVREAAIEANALAPAFKAAEYLFSVGTALANRTGHAIQSAIDAYKYTPH